MVSKILKVENEERRVTPLMKGQVSRRRSGSEREDELNVDFGCCFSPRYVDHLET